MWLKLTDGFHSHPKVLRAGNAAVGLWARCATYSAAYLTDGHVPAEVAVRFASDAAELERLTASGLWLPEGHGYTVNGYLEHNPTAEDIRRRLAERSEANRRAGQARAAKAQRDALGHFLPDLNGEPW